MIRVIGRLRRQPEPDPMRHLDEATLGLLLRGEEVAGTEQAAGHLAVCAACRRRMETADPLVSLFAEEEVPAVARRAVVAMPVVTRLVPRPHWQLSAGLAVAAAAALALAVVHLPGGGSPLATGPSLAQQQALTDVQRITAMIRTAAQQHDQMALRHALAEAQAQLAHIDAEHIGDAQLSAELKALRHEVASLPHDPATVALVSGVENLIAQAPGETGGAQPSSPAPVGGADATAAPAETPVESPGATPEPTPEATPQPTPEPTPEPTPAPTADATPTDAQPTPDASPTPDNSVAMTGDRTPPY